MPQKPLLKVGKKIGKKAQAANKHGKSGGARGVLAQKIGKSRMQPNGDAVIHPCMHAGHYEKPPKKGIELQRYNDNRVGRARLSVVSGHNSYPACYCDEVAVACALCLCLD